MNAMLAYCGLDCTNCPVRLATLEQDKIHQQKMRELIVEKCSSDYGINLQLEDITNCDGCRTNTGRLFSGCNQCGIRECAIKNGIENCAFCSGYACELLLSHFRLDPDAQTRLEAMRIA